VTDGNFSEPPDEDVLFDDEVSEPDDELGALTDAGDESGIDDEADSVAVEAREERDPLGLGRSTQDLDEVESAEEAAMHLTDDPPMDDDDGYLT
jgi:hypothetical protein